MLRKLVSTFLVLCLMSLGVCALAEDNSEPIPVTIVLSGWVNTPIDTDVDDPFRAYIRENYNLDVTLAAYSAGDFSQQLPVLLASDEKPDLICFSSYTDFQKYYEQGAFIDDWKDYFEYLPTMAPQMLANDYALTSLGTEDGGVKALFGNGEWPTWCVKARVDWIAEYASEKGLGEDYTISTPDELLDFARWVRDTKNEDPNNLSVYAFSSSGSGNQIGTTFEWTQLMFNFTMNGLSNQAARGFYITEDGTVSHPVLDGSYAEWLDFAKTCVDEKLISPDWFTQDWGTKGGMLYNQTLAFDWYPGAIVNETYSNNVEVLDDPGEVLNWWGNMDTVFGIPTSGSIGHIWTVTKVATMDDEKMQAICKLLDDVTITYDESATDASFYKRSATYDALRWGLGILPHVTYVPIEGTTLVACNTSAEEGVTDFRADYPGSWDYGCFFSTRSDGVVQMTGSDETSMKIASKVGELEGTTGALKQTLTPGSQFQYDDTILTRMFEEYTAFTYAYMTGKDSDIDGFVQKWRTELGGDDMIAYATELYTELGYIN